jgi:hypothetical protein
MFSTPPIQCSVNNTCDSYLVLFHKVPRTNQLRLPPTSTSWETVIHLPLNDMLSLSSANKEVQPLRNSLETSSKAQFLEAQLTTTSSVVTSDGIKNSGSSWIKNQRMISLESIGYLAQQPSFSKDQKSRCLLIQDKGRSVVCNSNSKVDFLPVVNNRSVSLQNSSSSHDQSFSIMLKQMPCPSKGRFIYWEYVVDNCNTNISSSSSSLSVSVSSNNGSCLGFGYALKGHNTNGSLARPNGFGISFNFSAKSPSNWLCTRLPQKSSPTPTLLKLEDNVSFSTNIPWNSGGNETPPKSFIVGNIVDSVTGHL